MKKKVFIIILSTLMILTACGSEISQSKYDSLNDKYGTLKEKYDSLNDNFDTLANEYAEYRITSVSEKAKMEKQIEDLKQQLSVAPTSNENQDEISDGSYEFSPGQYVVGEDISAGTYNISQIDGIGHFTLKNSAGNTIHSINETFNNLILEDGQIIYINTTAKYRISPVE